MSEKALLEQSATPDDKSKSAHVMPSKVWFTVGPFGVFLVIFTLVSILRPAFLTGGGLPILATQAATILLVALGQAMVLHVGSIDLSNAAIVVFAAIVLAQTLAPLGFAAPFVSIGLVTLIGAANGLLVAFGQIPSFALTLGTLGILQAASLVLSDATTVYATGNTQILAPLFGATFAGLPLAFWMGVFLAVGLWAFLRFTRPGEGMTAVGFNETGALFSGLQTRWLKVLAYALSGMLAGFAGVLIIAQAGAASSFGLGSDLLLPGIAAAMVGGTAIIGGTTNPINIVFGALTVALVPIGAAAVGITPQAQSLVYGLVIIAAVALTVGRGHSEVVK